MDYQYDVVTEMLEENEILDNTEKIAMNYAGLQFGNFPMLGDVMTLDDNRYDIL